MLHFFLVAGGGAIGTLLRYGLNGFIYHLLNLSYFPFGTFIINIIGCFVIGLFAGFAESQTITSEMRLFVQTGILGGFTTFSAFGYETFLLFRNGQVMLGLVNSLGQVIIGLIAVWIGYHFLR